MAAIPTKQDDDTKEDHSRSLNVRTENTFDEYVVLIVGVDDAYRLLENLSNVLSKDLVQSFDTIEAMLEFLNSQADLKVFLIISETLAKDYARQLRIDRRIIGLYIYCKSADRHTGWTTGDTKVRSVFSDSTALFAQLHCDISELRGRWSFDEKSFQKALTHTSQWYHLFLLIVCFRPEYPQECYEEMFDACRVYYNDNATMMKRIDELQANYNSQNAIREYTRDSFVYRIINHALRTQNMETIKKFSPFISDLHRQLRELHQNYALTEGILIRSVYRGQYLSSAELNSLRSIWKSNSGIITLTTFGSTSLYPDVAMSFVSFPPDDQIPCLFEIILTDSYNDKQKEMYYKEHDAFANIMSVSVMRDEQEVLFAPGIHFLIKSIDEQINQSDFPWVAIVLEAVSKADNVSRTNYSNIIKHIRHEIDPRIYNEILHMLQVNANNELKFQSTNWTNWWNALYKQWSKNYLSDSRQSLHLIFYSCFTEDHQWSRKAIEMYKIQLRFIPAVQADRSSFSSLFKKSKSWANVPTIWIALYEDYLKEFCQTASEEAAKCLCFAGELYGKIGDHQCALDCYQQASVINNNDQYHINKHIQKQVKTLEKLCEKMSATDHQRTTTREELSSVHQKQPDEQWAVYRMINQCSVDRSSIQSLLSRLWDYIERREKSYDHYDSKIVLRFPHEITDDLSVNDYYGNFFVALHRHLFMSSSRREAANNHSLSLWRYHKYLTEWTLFKSLETFLQPFEMKFELLRRSVLPQMKRFLKKLTTLLVICFFYICVQQTGEKVYINTAPLIHMMNSRSGQLIVDDLSRSGVRAAFEALEADTAVGETISITIPDNKRFAKHTLADFLSNDLPN
jgi:hypothetical protein